MSLQVPRMQAMQTLLACSTFTTFAFLAANVHDDSTLPEALRVNVFMAGLNHASNTNFHLFRVGFRLNNMVTVSLAVPGFPTGLTVLIDCGASAHWVNRSTLDRFAMITCDEDVVILSSCTADESVLPNPAESQTYASLC
ncbi:hypothetical protein H310_14276 [Aphanomyces invadans]|uniref:Uncharacterized protein n=1 Tax=Aphanomyces invadans TaxID=157072 RepID=A0A024TBQ8_9STRA|nr:hypothetical protein H310_14276 [Aphanomyces invadans]ETV91036.1 hypothetical protein H310_14276 [Aphanomyces invadans]|eukprot:XP_008880316.1 hypothetical protein H310_14276 [Aphanomyces invadans]